MKALIGLGLLSFAPEVRAKKELIWEEDFNYNGAPKPQTWSYDVGHNNGWGNGELQTYTSDSSNVNVENGVLKITAQRDGDEFTSARIKTADKFSFTYGILEAWIKVPDLDAGLWPAFWTMGSDFYQVGWPKSGEINIMEMGQGLAINEGVVNKRVVSAAHWDIFGQYATYAKSYDSSVDLNLAYHNYTLEWTDQKMVTYVDGNWIWEINIGEECPSCAELHQPHHILLSMAVGGGFTSGGSSSSAAASSSSSVGCGSSSSSAADTRTGLGCGMRGANDITAPFPAVLAVDWIRLYDNGGTQIFPKPPTPAPTPMYVVPATTKRPTPRPTPRPTVAPVIPATKAPVGKITNAPFVIPVTQSPNIRNPDPVTGGGRGKGKSKGVSFVSGSRSTSTDTVTSTDGGYSRDPGTIVSYGKGGKGGNFGSRSGVAGSRSGVSGKGKGFGGTIRQPGVGGGKGKPKGKWRKSGSTAIDNGAGSGRNSPSSATVQTPTFSAPVAPPAASPVAGTNRQTPMPSPRPTNGPVGGTDFEPMDDDETSTDSADSSDSGGSQQLGPQSLVVQPFSGASTTRTCPLLSILLVALGIITVSY